MVDLVRAPFKSQYLAESLVSGSTFESYLKLRVLRQITVANAIQSLNQTAFKLGSLQSTYFCRLLAGISIEGSTIAIIEYNKKRSREQKSAHSARDSDNVKISTDQSSGFSISEPEEHDLTLNGIKPISSSRNASSLNISGWATSREDPRLRIYYEFSNEAAGASQLFMTIIDALATASTNLPFLEILEPLTAIGKNQLAETRLHIESSGAPATSFTWARLVQALVVFWEQGIFSYHVRREDNRWNVLDLLLIQYDGTTIAYGVMNIRYLP